MIIGSKKPWPWPWPWEEPRGDETTFFCRLWVCSWRLAEGLSVTAGLSSACREMPRRINSRAAERSPRVPRALNRCFSLRLDGRLYQENKGNQCSCLKRCIYYPLFFFFTTIKRIVWGRKMQALSLHASCCTVWHPVQLCHVTTPTDQPAARGCWRENKQISVVTITFLISSRHPCRRRCGQNKTSLTDRIGTTCPPRCQQGGGALNSEERSHVSLREEWL